MASQKKSRSRANQGSTDDPTKLPITEKGAQHLASLSGLDAKELTGKSVAEVTELVKWRVDPQLLLLRRVCGRVVKQNPATGELCPVPGATVHVEDTDCSYYGYFPAEPPFSYLFPLSCHREEIATVTTDACGRFCVFLPYWEIDRILLFRRVRICFPEIFIPNLRDIIELLPEPPIIRDPRPQPDPLPIHQISPEMIEQVRTHFNAEIADRLEVLVDSPEFGASNQEYLDLLETPLPTSPPPLPSSFLENPQAIMAETAEGAGLEAKFARDIDYSRFIGPFFRCKDVFVAEWMPFFDVPDITFRVTQDVDNDGTEEDIYNEGFFAVRWNAGSIPDVTLVANAKAICVPFCGPVVEIPCENEPVINTAGYMPLADTHHNNANGYGRRVNRPQPGDSPPPPWPGDSPPPPSWGSGAVTAVSPYGGTLNLFGCHRIGDVTHYRLTYVKGNIGEPPPLTGSPVPFTGITWDAPRSALAPPGLPFPVVPDSDGWYPILTPPEHLEHPNWLLHWNTRDYDDAIYVVRLEVGKPGTGGGMTIIATSDPKVFTVDNSKPKVSFLEIRWRYANISGPWTNTNSIPLPADCPVIHRDPTKDIRVRIRWSATAKHLRNAQVRFRGCGGGHPLLVEPTPLAPNVEAYQHWHINQLDNAVMQTNEFEIPSSRPPGCYTTEVAAYSRAFEPRGDYGPAYHWLITQTLWWWRESRSISVVDA